jgi:hypothetical protein
MIEEISASTGEVSLAHHEPASETHSATASTSHREEKRPHDSNPAPSKENQKTFWNRQSLFAFVCILVLLFAMAFCGSIAGYAVWPTNTISDDGKVAMGQGTIRQMKMQKRSMARTIQQY